MPPVPSPSSRSQVATVVGTPGPKAGETTLVPGVSTGGLRAEVKLLGPPSGDELGAQVGQRGGAQQVVVVPAGPSSASPEQRPVSGYIWLRRGCQNPRLGFPASTIEVWRLAHSACTIHIFPPPPPLHFLYGGGDG